MIESDDGVWDWDTLAVSNRRGGRDNDKGPLLITNAARQRGSEYASEWDSSTALCGLDTNTVKSVKSDIVTITYCDKLLIVTVLTTINPLLL